MSYEYKIGTTLGGLTLLSALSTPVIWPRHDFSPYSDLVDLGNGSRRGVGFPSATWAWDFIKAAQWTVLKTFRTDVATPIFIRTKDNYDTWHSYSGQMIWPKNEEWVVTRGLKFVLEFRALVQEA